MKEKKELNVATGNRIRISRERARITQEELAERLNLSAQFISTIERGIAGPSLETIINLCIALNVSSDWLLRGMTASPTTQSIAEKLSILSEEQLASIDRIIDELLIVLQKEGSGKSAEQRKQV